MKLLPQTLTSFASMFALAGQTAFAQEASPALPAAAAAPATAAVQPIPAAEAYRVPHVVALDQAGALPVENVQWELLGGQAKPRSLIIRSGETDSKMLSNLEEDLNVMSRIFTKALKESNIEEDAMMAMGMKIRALNLAGQSSVQNLYLDGYGALFTLHVPFPLLPPPEPSKEDATAKESKDTAWDEARRELYGPKETGPAVARLFVTKDKIREAYDAKKVSRLKESLIDALKNASNIRNLKPEEFITVVVIGRESGPVALAVKKVEAGRTPLRQVNVFAAPGGIVGGSGGVAFGATQDGQTILTIRAKKADVDACAKGDLKVEEFQKKVSFATY
ncbi:MAG: hypothetical protein HY735_35240 [Verrucomicrobia bacterium]|nr:hypothetical protein [Verrucomicrobiota bacterium]